MRCIYCQGRKRVQLQLGRTLNLLTDPLVSCVDCLGTGEVCHLCGKPNKGDDPCECPPFDPQDRPRKA